MENVILTNIINTVDGVSVVYDVWKWSAVMLLVSNVITVILFNCCALLSAYLQLCIKYEYLTSVL